MCYLQVLWSLTLRASFHSLTLCLLLALSHVLLQEEDALLSEMDVTGQAFEDMQEQNIRLMQQLREKDDANFKLMSERIKSNQIHKLLKEEKEELADQLLTLKTQVSLTADTRYKLHRLGFGVADPDKLQLPSIILLCNALLNALQTQSFNVE